MIALIMVRSRMAAWHHAVDEEVQYAAHEVLVGAQMFRVHVICSYAVDPYAWDIEQNMMIRAGFPPSRVGPTVVHP